MEEVIRNLKEKEIIYWKSIEVIKKYIEDKYPEANAAFRAQVFADAVHKIIDDHIREFRRADQRKIKQDLLIRRANKENFEIVAYDIMKTCVALDITEETFVNNLTSWINREQELPVYQEQMDLITDLVKEDLEEEKLLEVVDEEALSHTLDLFEPASEAPISDDDALLDQIEAAFDYEPRASGDHEETIDIPELFTQGVINEAYEAEMRKDLAGLEAGSQGPMEDVVIHDLDIQGSLSPIGGEGSLLDDDRDLATFEDKDDRPVIKLAMDPEPYFSETPDLWEVPSKETSIIEGLKAAVSKYSKKTVVMAIVGACGITIIIWIIIMMIIYLRPSETTVPASNSKDLGAVMLVSEVHEAAPLLASIETEQMVEDQEVTTGDLHESLSFKEIDQVALKQWFERNGSLVGQSPYFETIIEVAEDYGVNPLLLFAITGQEQAFVPLDHEFADLMINNPFNVYGSWENYNTDLEESAQIASRTILTASEDRPEAIDPIQWINKTYAEDDNWSTGVTIILKQLEAQAGN